MGDTETYLKTCDVTDNLDRRISFSHIGALEGINIPDVISKLLATSGFFYLGNRRTQCSSCSIVLKIPLSRLHMEYVFKILHCHSQKSPSCIFSSTFANQKPPHRSSDAVPSDPVMLVSTSQSKLIRGDTNGTGANNNCPQNLEIASMASNNYKPPVTDSSAVPLMMMRQHHLDTRQRQLVDVDLQSNASSKSSLTDGDIYDDPVSGPGSDVTMKPSVTYKDENSMTALLQTSVTTGIQQVGPSTGVVVEQAEPVEEMVPGVDIDVESTESSEEGSFRSMDLYGDEATVRDEEIRQWQELKLCKICRIHDADVVFLPCGHLCGCNYCLNAPDTVNINSSWSKYCFKCGKLIVKMVKISRA